MNHINEVLYLVVLFSILCITTTHLPALSRLTGLHPIQWSLSRLKKHALQKRFPTVSLRINSTNLTPDKDLMITAGHCRCMLYFCLSYQFLVYIQHLDPKEDYVHFYSSDFIVDSGSPITPLTL